MSGFVNFFRVILYRPLFNVLIFLYAYLPGHDLGIAVIGLTIIIKLLFFPLSLKAIKSQKALSELQPKIKEIQKKYKDDKGKQSREIMEMYKREKVSPFSGCLPLLIQFPVLIALFWVFRTFEGGLSGEEFQLLYPFISQPEIINTQFLGVIDLIKPSAYLAVLAGVFQFFQTKMMTPKIEVGDKKKTDFSGMMQKQMQYLFPIITVVILFRLPSAIGLYWLTTTLFSVIQQYVVLKKKNGKFQTN